LDSGDHSSAEYEVFVNTRFIVGCGLRSALLVLQLPGWLLGLVSGTFDALETLDLRHFSTPVPWRLRTFGVPAPRCPRVSVYGGKPNSSSIEMELGVRGRSRGGGEFPSKVLGLSRT